MSELREQTDSIREQIDELREQSDSNREEIIELGEQPKSIREKLNGLIEQLNRLEHLAIIRPKREAASFLLLSMGYKMESVSADNEGCITQEFVKAIDGPMTKLLKFTVAEKMDGQIEISANGSFTEKGYKAELSLSELTEFAVLRFEHANHPDLTFPALDSEQFFSKSKDFYRLDV